MTEKKAEPTILHNTFVVERSYPLPPERVFAAFADPSLKRKWFVDGPNKQISDYELDFRVGGNERVDYGYLQGTPYPNQPFINVGNYQVIDPNKRIVLANTMSVGGHCFSAALVSFEFLPNATGTDLICTHQGAFFENADGPQIREMGWKTLLERLGTALETA